MKNLKTFNPIILARNAIAATGIMTILNIIIVALHFSPIFPLSLLLPITTSYFVFNTPDTASVISVFGSLEKFYSYRPFYAVITLLVIVILVYSYFRSAKKPGAIKIGFGVIVFDTLILLLSFNLSITFFIDVLYHAALLYYIFKGIAALKAAKNA